MDALIYDTDERIAEALLGILKSADGVDRVAATTQWADLHKTLIGQPRSVVVLGPGVGEGDLIKVPGMLNNFPATTFVQVVEALDASSLKRAMRFGIRDVLAVEDGGSELAETVLRAAGFARSETTAGSGRQHGRGKVVTVFGTKGGTGKSFLATNLAVLSAKAGISTALLDASVRFGDCASLLRIRPVHTLADLGGVPAVDDSLLASVLADHDSGTRVLCAPYDPLAADELDALVITRAAQALRGGFDLTVIDTGPALDGFTLAALEECDLSLLITSLEVPAVKDAKVCLSAFERLGLNPDQARVVLNRANSSVSFPMQEVSKSLGAPLFAEFPSDVAVPRSMNEGIPVSLKHPKAKVSKALAKLTKDVHGELGLAESKDSKSTQAVRFASSRPAES